MTDEQALESMRRILALLNLRDEDSRDYVRTVSEACGWMQAFRFDAVCRLVAGEMHPSRRPTPRQFKDAYRRLSTEKGWGDAAKTCATCGGIGFLYGHVIHSCDGKTYECVKPCHECNRNLKPDADPEHVIWMDQGAKGWMERDVESMSPEAALKVLEVVQGRGGMSKLPDAAIAALTTKAGELETQPVDNDTMPDIEPPDDWLGGGNGLSGTNSL